MKPTNSITKAFLKGAILLLAFALAGAVAVPEAQADATLSFTSYAGTANASVGGVTDTSAVNLGAADLTQPQPSGTGGAQIMQEVGVQNSCGAGGQARRDDVGFTSPPTSWDFTFVFGSGAGRTVGCPGLTASGDIDGTFTGQLVVPADTPSLTIEANLEVSLCAALCGGSATGTNTLQIKDSLNNLIVDQTVNRTVDGVGTAA